VAGKMIGCWERVHGLIFEGRVFIIPILDVDLYDPDTATTVAMRNCRQSDNLDCCIPII